jgi:hypothetical protein
MATEAWVGLNEGQINQNNEHGQNRQADIHGLTLLLNYRMQIQCPLLKLVTR